MLGPHLDGRIIRLSRDRRFFYLFHYASQAKRLDLVELLKPACFARSLTFNYKTWRYSMLYAEDEVYRQGLTFLNQLPCFHGLFWQKEHSAD